MRLTTFSWLAVVIGIACAAIGWLGLAGWLAALVVAASIAAHVAGNALGTRLREASDRDHARRGPRPPVAPLPQPLPPSRLERRASLGSLVPISAAIGGCCGGVSGAVALRLLTSSSVAGAVLGGVSSAVIGGLAGFLGASFVEIVRTSVRDAVEAERRAARGEPGGGTNRVVQPLAGSARAEPNAEETMAKPHRSLKKANHGSRPANSKARKAKRKHIRT